MVSDDTYSIYYYTTILQYCTSMVGWKAQAVKDTIINISVALPGLTSFCEFHLRVSDLSRSTQQRHPCFLLVRHNSIHPLVHANKPQSRSTRCCCYYTTYSYVVLTNTVQYNSIMSSSRAIQIIWRTHSDDVVKRIFHEDSIVNEIRLPRSERC